MTVKEGSMHTQEVYLHPYCLVVTRYTYLPWVIPAGIFFQPPRGVTIIAWAAEHACGFYKGDLLLCVCVFVIGEEGREVKCRQD